VHSFGWQSLVRRNALRSELVKFHNVSVRNIKPLHPQGQTVIFSVSALTGTRIARLEDCAGMRGDRNWQYLSTWLVPLAAHANGVCNRARHLWSRPSWYLWRSNLALIPVEDKQKKKKKKDWVWSDAAMCSASCFFTKFSSLCHVLVKQCYHYGITWEQDANGCHILFTWYLIWSNQVDEDELCMSERELYEARQKYK